MTDPVDSLSRAARQLVAIEQLLGGQFIPAERTALPEITAACPAAGTALTPKQKAEALAAIDSEEVRSCDRCPLAAARTNAVFGEGDPGAELVFIGEAPGRDEDLSGRPFVGRAGELLTKMISAMGLTRRQVFICNMLKCRPPNNRTPTPDEVAACWDYLVRQLQIIAPKVIVTMGNPATKGLLSTTTGITRMRGNWQQLPDIGDGLAGIPVMPTFHPAYLLRYYNQQTRSQVWSDIQKVMTRLGLPLPTETRCKPRR